MAAATSTLLYKGDERDVSCLEFAMLRLKHTVMSELPSFVTCHAWTEIKMRKERDKGSQLGVSGSTDWWTLNMVKIMTSPPCRECEQE